MYGAYGMIENRPALCFERRLSHPIDVVWRAITESDELEHWFPSRVEVDALGPKRGNRFRSRHYTRTRRRKFRRPSHRKAPQKASSTG